MGRRIALHEIGYDMLRRAETRESHYTVSMLVGTDRGPIHMWCCPVLNCGRVAYTYNAADLAPQCSGGMHWSFSTTNKFDNYSDD